MHEQRYLNKDRSFVMLTSPFGYVLFYVLKLSNDVKTVGR
jgi:hypothetical protein